MKNRFSKIVPALLPIALFAWQDAVATTVYQWTDEEGMVHFSDVPPADVDKLDTREIDFAEYAEYDAADDEYSVINQLERMTEWRRQISEERMARKQLQLEEQRMAEEQNNYRFNTASRSVVYPSTSHIFPYSPHAGHFSHHKKRRFHGFSRHHGGFSAGFNKGGFNKGFRHSTPNFKLRNYKAGPGL